jgi:hypothetical protein
MRRLPILLRMLVFVGALLLLVSYPRGPRAQGVRGGAQDAFTAMPDVGACNNVQGGESPCPSGCTASSFYQEVTQPGNGVYELVYIGPAPCGQAKSGETCSPPAQYGDNYIFAQCCAALGLDCTGVGHNYMNCCDPSPVVCMGTCCIGNGGSCSPSRPGDCCTGLCLSYNNECGTCSSLGGQCGNASDCCYYSGVSCPSGTCCIEKGGHCTHPSDCCSGYRAPCGMCEYT